MAEQFVDIIGASMRSAALTSEGWRPHMPRLILDGVDGDGQKVHVTIFGGFDAVEPARELEAAAQALAAASERVEAAIDDRRIRRRLNARSYGDRPDGDAA